MKCDVDINKFSVRLCRVVRLKGERVGAYPVPFVVPGLSASSSSTTTSPTSPSSSSQDSVIDVNRYAENPVQERSGSTSEELRGDPLHESTETENKIKNGEREEAQKRYIA